MNRSRPLQRRSPLLAKTALRRSKPLAKRSRKQRKRDAELERFKRVVRRRSGGICEVSECGRTAKHFHHRRLRSQGGTHAPENLMHVCTTHHRVIHDNPLWASELGLIRRRDQEPDPDEVAMGKSLATFDAAAFCRAKEASSDGPATPGTS